MHKLAGLAAGAVLAVTAMASAAIAQDQGPLVFVSGPLSDPYFGAIKTGADEAAKDLGITNYQYTTVPSYDDIVPLYTRLMESAIALKPSAIVLGDFFPDALNPLIKQAADAGIAVVVQGSGRDAWRSLGAIGYVGEDSTLMGKFAGEAAAKAGVTDGVCVNTVGENPSVEQRCQGYVDAIKAAGGTATVIQMNYADNADPQKQQQAVGAVLSGDPKLNGIFTVNPAVAITAVEAAKEANRKVNIATTDLSAAVIDAIKSGDVAFAVDQQPFLQGYYGVLVAYQYIKYGVKPATEINSGPLIVDAKAADAVIAANKAYPGVRGGN